MAFNPVSSFLVWYFKQQFLHDPQQRNTRVAHLVMSEDMSGENQFQNIVPQVDGIDYDPASTTLRLGNTPMFNFPTVRIGYRKRGHIWGHPVATEDWHRTTPGYQGLIAGLAAGAFARFKDRIILHNADSYRLVAPNGGDFSSLTQEALPLTSRYAIVNTSTSGSVDLQNLDVETLRAAKLYEKNNEVGIDGMDGESYCFASPTQIQALLGDNNVTSQDYNVVRALVNGEVDSFMGYKFVHTKAGQDITSADDVYFRNARRDVAITATTNYSKLSGTATAEKIVFCKPMKAFAIGDLARSAYTNVWQNPDRMGTWEYTHKEVKGYKRCQNEYVFVAYAKPATATGIAIRKAPSEYTEYNANYDTDGGNWSYTATKA